MSNGKINGNARISYGEVEIRFKRISEKAVLAVNEYINEEAWVPRSLFSTDSNDIIERSELGDTAVVKIQQFKLDELGW